MLRGCGPCRGADKAVRAGRSLLADVPAIKAAAISSNSAVSLGGRARAADHVGDDPIATAFHAAMRVRAYCVTLVVTAARAECPWSSTTRAMVASREPGRKVAAVSVLMLGILGTSPPVASVPGTVHS
jgi:hypothetical protein